MQVTINATCIDKRDGEFKNDNNETISYYKATVYNESGMAELTCESDVYDYIEIGKSAEFLCNVSRKGALRIAEVG